MTITPATYNFVVYRNGDVRQDVTIKVNGTELDLTDYVAELQVRDSLTDSAVAPRLAIDSDTPTVHGSQIAFPDPENGVLQIFIDNLDMETLPLAKAKTGEHVYVYDLLLTQPAGGDVDPYLSGNFTVHNGVTR